MIGLPDEEPRSGLERTAILPGVITPSPALNQISAAAALPKGRLGEQWPYAALVIAGAAGVAFVAWAGVAALKLVHLVG